MAAGRQSTRSSRSRPVDRHDPPESRPAGVGRKSSRAGHAPFADISRLRHKARMRPFARLPAFFALAACATQPTEPMNGDFSPPTAAEITSGFELRDRYKLPTHLGVPAIYVDTVAVHHLRSETSTIVWKDDNGRWQRTRASEIGPGGLLPVKPQLQSREETSLTDVEAHSLERLIRDRDLYSGKVRRTGQFGIGSPVHTMAIVTSFGRTTVKWEGRLRGKNGAVADIVLGHE